MKKFNVMLAAMALTLGAVCAPSQGYAEEDARVGDLTKLRPLITSGDAYTGNDFTEADADKKTTGTLVGAVNSLSDYIAKDKQELQAQITANKEAADKTQSDLNALNRNVSDNVSKLNNALASNVTALVQNDAAEVAARDAADKNLQSQITANKTAADQTQKDLSGLHDEVVAGFDTINKGVWAEVAERKASDKDLQDQITANKAAADQTQADLSKLNGEVVNTNKALNETNRIIGEVNGEVVKTNVALNAEVAARDAADKAEAAARAAEDARLNGEIVKTNETLGKTNESLSALNGEVVKTNAALNAEVAARAAEDARLNGEIVKTNETLGKTNESLSALNGEVVKTNTALNAEVAARDAADTAEAAARAAEDARLNEEIVKTNTELGKTNTALSGLHDDVVLGFDYLNKVDEKEQQDRAAADEAEAQARQEADAALDAKIGTTKYASTNYVTAESDLTTAVGALDSALAGEAYERAAADAALGSRIEQVNRHSREGIARAVALAGLHPLDFDPDNKLDFAAASGHYKNENAFALGAFYRPNRNIMLSFGTTLSGNDDAYNFGVSFKVGRSGEKKQQTVPSVSELYAMLSAMQEKLDAQQETIAAQQTRIEELEAK